MNASLPAELIREQLMQRLHQELPYALTVEIEEFKRNGGMLRIGAIIWVERDGQKQIVIGKGGKVLKQVGTGARHELQELFGEKVFVRLWVKVSRDWSDSETGAAAVRLRRLTAHASPVGTRFHSAQQTLS